ncbi:MAG: ROK family glucokinase [bacterium]|nr:ROK family glucokinase [bacterium]
MYYIGIDLGGTTVKAGIVDEQYRILASAALLTESQKGAESLVSDMSELVQSLLAQSKISMDEIASIGLGVPGTANRRTRKIEFANNLEIGDEPLADLLEKKLSKPVFFDNDANAAAWGEYLAGSGRGYRSMIMVTLGTGVGGGIVLNGKLYEGCNYAAGEFGHFVIQCEGGLPCNCGRRGCFEQYASATALIRMTQEAMQKKEGADSLLWELCQGELCLVDGRRLFEALKQGDETAKQVFEAYVYYLSVGITDIINVFQPELLCIGGGISKAGELLLSPLKELVDAQIYTRMSAVKTKLQLAERDNDAGIIGAAMLHLTEQHGGQQL